MKKMKIWQEDEVRVKVLWYLSSTSGPVGPPYTSPGTHLPFSPEIGVHKRNFKKIRICVVHLSIYRQMVCIKINNYLIQH
jgi:hypothetical protein